jgi:hypothetical protein
MYWDCLPKVEGDPDVDLTVIDKIAQCLFHGSLGYRIPFNGKFLIIQIGERRLIAIKFLLRSKVKQNARYNLSSELSPAKRNGYPPRNSQKQKQKKNKGAKSLSSNTITSPPMMHPSIPL